MERKHLALVFVLAAICAAGVMAQNCEPDCGGKNPWDKVPDPKNCSQYYICVSDGLPSNEAVPCPPGEAFDTSVDPMDCGDEGAAVCDTSCVSNACHLYCNASLDFVANPKNCSQYHICLPGGVQSDAYSCPADRPVFDGTDCVVDKAKCCDANDLCQPVCEPGVVQAPDPIDCHKFYICVNGIIDEAYHFDCGAGEYFDIQAGLCIPGTTCENLCDAGTETTTPGGGGGTTPGGGGTTTPEGGGGTTSTPQVTTTVPEITTTPDCVTSLTCTDQGYFAMCHTCQPFYYQCDASGYNGILLRCAGDLVFNPDPAYPYCILESNCPYSP